MRSADKLGQALGFDPGWQAAADDQQRAALDGQHFLFQLAKFIFAQRRARHHKAILLVSGFNMHVQVLPGPVMGIDRIHGDLLISQKRDKVFTRRAARRKDGGSFSAEVNNGARHVNPTAAGFENRRAAAKFTFRIELSRQGCAVQRGGERQRKDTIHADLL
ncbi:hypothetical protein D3C76_1170630 [compost metagenome]